MNITNKTVQMFDKRNHDRPQTGINCLAHDGERVSGHVAVVLDDHLSSLWVGKIPGTLRACGSTTIN
jgi:hypothetical protein